ncbi:MAG: Gfo/Idh/MocA family oxidoreductase [Deltaproteobacteria bacterium]|nr:Gfo/Idh/MocA family oxidoreductase [Deltaproteobacteria bacterium]
MMNVAVVGCGRWGVNYVRIFEELTSTRVDWAFDKDELSLKRLVHRFPTVKAAKTINEILNCPDIDAVVVATPAAEHYEVVRKCLLAGKHVLVEKPVALTIEDTEEMIELAAAKKKILMVGHTFIFNSGIKTLKNFLRDDSFGKIYYLHATRTNMGPIRHDVNAIWDLAPHDVSIFNFLLDKTPDWVSATGVKLFENGREDVGFITLGYPDNVIANIHVSWADPYKVREVVAVGSRRRITFNDLDSLERVKVFDKGVIKDTEAESFGEFRLLMRDGDIMSPRVETTEPLKEQCLHFIDCVSNNRNPVSDGLMGLDVVKAMLAVDESLKMQGAPVQTARLGARA